MFGGDSTVDLTYSFHYSKLSCWQPFYVAHVIFAYLIFLTGIACMVTRLWTRTQFLHLWLGKFYIMFMLWGTATSLLIHNTGLPIGVLYSFLWTLLGLCTGWVAITIHQKIRFKRSTTNQSKTQNIISRMISLKGFHGCIMFVSWINIAGRVFVTPVSKDFSCFTYPAYKPVANSHYNYTVGSPLTFVEAVDPHYNRLPWANREGAWAAIMLFAPYIGAFVVSYFLKLISKVWIHLSICDSQRHARPS